MTYQKYIVHNTTMVRVLHICFTKTNYAWKHWFVWLAAVAEGYSKGRRANRALDRLPRGKTGGAKKEICSLTFPVFERGRTVNNSTIQTISTIIQTLNFFSI
ncbi:hypothetical protein NPIL_286061 [Nephila pilipes]|uniref:Uncharacterized protein n=1 Tax=Nephila pilipes TaxID=299642 RepID=A0A8X6TIZ0_NEPPI|nr:hypothetical protein NPIL_286061 [Nephila pilipes]